jgi:hypothetical protein
MPRPSRKRILKLLGAIGGIGCGCLAFLVILFAFIWIKVLVPHSRQRAEQGWASIGRPMSEFEKRLKPVAENDSFRELIRDLQPFGVKSFYKAQEGNDPKPISLPKQIPDIIDPSVSPAADEVDLFRHDLSYLDQHAADLSRLYQGLLQRQPPVWTFVPRDGTTLGVPSYLTARNVSQLIWVDALRKLERGEQQDAEDAVAAGLKMTSNIGEQPILLSQMIRVAIDASYAPLIARLPEDPCALENFAAEVEAKREMWRAAVQTETCVVAQVVDYLGLKPDAFKTLYENSSPIQKVRMSLGQSWLEADCSRSMMRAAAQVRVTEEVGHFALSDLGVAKINEISSNYAPIFTTHGSLSDMFGPNWFRSWIRLNAALLLREQAEIIRSTRAQVQLGKSGKLGDVESIVIPGAKWQITADPNANSVSLKLTPIPSWTSNRDGIPEKTFFLLPLDGSKSWKFRPRSLPSAAATISSR